MLNKIIELTNDEKYLVIKEVMYSNRHFLLLGKVIGNEDDISDDLEIYERINSEIIKVDNKELFDMLMDNFLVGE